MYSVRVRIFLGVLCAGWMSVAHAVDIPPLSSLLPSSVQPAQVQKRLQSETFPIPEAQPSIKRPEAPKPAFLGAEKIHFKLKEVRFKGNTVFTTAELMKIVTPKLNKQISLGDLQALVKEVTVKYRNAGFVLSQAILPPQTINNGVVTVQIIEGFIQKVTIQGKPGVNKCLMYEMAQQAIVVRPLRIKLLEHSMLLMNDLPGMTAKAVLTPSKTVPAAADLAVDVDHKLGSAFATYDNYGTRYLGPQEIMVGASLFSIIAPGDSNSARFSRTFKRDQMRFAEYVHSQSLGSQGMRGTFGTSYTETHPGFILEPAHIIGRSYLAYTDLSYPFVRTRTDTFIGHVAFNYQNVTSSILDLPFYQDRIRSFVIGFGYQGSDRWKGLNGVGLDLIQGMPMLGADMHELQSRPRGRTRYTRATVGVSRLQGINSRFSLFAAAAGQYSCNPLLASEQFPFGGPDFGRGYDPAEIIADRGVKAKFELRLDVAPGWKILNAIQYYVFYDLGVLWNLDTVNLLTKQSATSVGAGARFTFFPNLLTGNLFIAQPLTHRVGTQVALGESGYVPRGFFQLVATI